MRPRHLTTYGGVKKRGLVEECPSKAVQRREKGINHLEGTEERG